MSKVDDAIEEALKHPKDLCDYECAIAALECRTQGRNACNDADYGETAKERMQGHYDGWNPSLKFIKDVAFAVIVLIVMFFVLLIGSWCYSKFVLGTLG